MWDGTSRLVKDAEYRFWTDAEFHAKVQAAVQDTIGGRGPRPRLSEEAMGFARACVSVALLQVEDKHGPIL